VARGTAGDRAPREPVLGTSGVPDPAVSPLLGPHLHRPLAAAEDLGRELFWSRRGGGAHRDHAPIRVSGATDPQRAVVGSTYTFKMRIEAYVALVEGILRAGADHRRMGSTALMMCHVADGRLDGCVTGYCNSWDVIGGLFLVQEAGGVASDFIAENGLLEPGSALACTPGLQQILEQVRGRSAR
jgi:myo-inositol-1(or 4)-monophosphatase